MSESFTSSYVKSINDLAGKILIPALTSSLLVEFGLCFQDKFDLGLLITYLIFVGISASIAGMFFLLLTVISYKFNGMDFAPYISVAIMPLGFAGLFPEQFTGSFTTFTVPYSQVTGVAILVWAFMLANRGAWHKYVR